MNIALPILLLVFGGLTLWMLTESAVKWYFKASCISAFCVFTIIFWGSIHTFLGWPANESDAPEKVRIHWVVIKEPDKITKFEGAIYVLLESAETEESSLFRFFGYRNDRMEPRLYELSYSRELHEQLERGVMEKLKNGQPVLGKLKKGRGAEGKKSEDEKKGDGSESQSQDWYFHELRPSDFIEKSR